MNDLLKGFSILSLTALAIFMTLQYEQSASVEDADVLALQQALLQGADPTQIQPAPAAGSPDAQCRTGDLTITDPQLPLHQRPYSAVLSEQRFYVRVHDPRVLLELQNPTATTAKQLNSLPKAVALSLADFGQLEQRCLTQSLVISKIVQ